MKPLRSNDWDTRQPRWLVPLFVFTIIMSAGFGAVLAFVTYG